MDGRVDQLGVAQAVAEAGLGIRYGPWFMFSMPPATTISASPARISAAASMIAFRPEPQTRLMVVALVESASPAFRAAWRAGAWPTPAWSTWPMRTSSILVCGHAGALDGGADRDAAQRRCGHVRERPAELADRRPRRRHDEHLPVGAVPIRTALHPNNLTSALGRCRATMGFVARLQRRRFSETKDVRHPPSGRIEVVELDDRVVARIEWAPGWRWSKDLKPIAGTDACMSHHVGLSISGRLRIQMEDGVEMELGPGDVFEIPPGHDAWVIGDEPYVSVDFEALRGFAAPGVNSRRRILASILMTDIVDSTALAVSHGAARWREVVRSHNKIAERAIDQGGGRMVKTTGDGVIALFDSAERAIATAVRLIEAVHPLGLRIRTTVHSGEVEVTESDVVGVVVHATARMLGLAGPDEVIVSSTVHDLLDGTEFEFEDYGLHELKGLPGQRQMYLFIRPS